MKRVTLLLLLAAGAATPALAGTRAVYEERDARRTIHFEISDDGAFRAGSQTRYRLVREDGVYEVATVDGRPYVARMEDLAAALKETTSPVVRSLAKAATFLGERGPGDWVITGRRKVNGRRGTEFRLAERGDVDTLDELDDTRLVLSRDPDLAPLGRAMLHYTADELYLKMHLVSGISAEAALRTLDEIADEGTVIASSEGDIRLLSVEAADIGPERLSLPAQPISRAEIVALIRAKRNPFR
jgi:hypothetical protein